MMYPSIFFEFWGMVQESKIPFDPTGPPINCEGGPGTTEMRRKEDNQKQPGYITAKFIQLCILYLHPKDRNYYLTNVVQLQNNSLSIRSDAFVSPIHQKCACVVKCVCGLHECFFTGTLMNKASHSSGISLAFTAELFIQWFKSFSLSYLKGIKQYRKYKNTHTTSSTLLFTLCVCVSLYLSIMAKGNRQQ